MKLRRTYINRRQIKSSEGEFIWELENSYELSPKLSFLILLKSKEYLLHEYVLKEGQIEITPIEVLKKLNRNANK